MARIPTPLSQKSFELLGTKYIVVTRAETGNLSCPLNRQSRRPKTLLHTLLLWLGQAQEMKISHIISKCCLD